MKRSFAFAALATLASTAAVAQSSVTVYGRLNTSVERQTDFDNTNSSVIRLQNNASRLGFKGVEDLGGGLKAGFVLEHRFNIDDGRATNAAFWGGAGTSEVYLGGNFGTVRLGHYTSEAYFATSDVTDLLNHGTGTSADALYKYLGSDNNKIAYRTPTFGGLTAEAGVSLGEGAVDAGGNRVQRIMDVAVNYAAGPFGLGFGYEKVKEGDSQFAVRGSYEFGPAMVTGYVQRYKNEAVDESKTIWRLSGMYTIGAAELHLAFGGAGKLESNGVTIEEKATQITVGANYNLSKRTKVFAFVNRVNFSNTNIDPQAIAVGVRHNF